MSPPLSTSLDRNLNIIILGESDSGKSSLTDRFVFDKHMVRYDPFGSEFPEHGSEYSSQRSLTVDGATWMLSLEDLSTTPMRTKEPGFRMDVWEERLRVADGVVLLYDITDKTSYEIVTDQAWNQIWSCRNSDIMDEALPLNNQKFGCVLVGTKFDLVQGGNASRREIESGLAEEWASMVGIRSFEVDAFDRKRLEDMMSALVKSIQKARRRNAEDLDEATAELISPPPKGIRTTDTKGNHDQAGRSSPQVEGRKNRAFQSLSRLRENLPRLPRFSTKSST